MTLRHPPPASKLAALAAACLLVAAAPQPAMAQQPDGTAELTPQSPVPLTAAGGTVDETADLWFVELPSAPTAEGTSRARLSRERTSFRAEAREAGVRLQERRSFETLWNGLSVRTDPAQALKLESLPSVSAVYPVASVPVPQTSLFSSPELATALAMTGADIAQDDLGLTGTGIKVAVMDTGIDYQHPNLGGCFGPFSPGEDCRVVAGYDFVGDDFNAEAPGSVPVPGPDPMDCNGHGTHVAGIIGANAAEEGGVVGVAPGVTFGAYKVFGCEGATTADIMIQAMEMAYADGMDVLNMSIGSPFQWAQYPTAQASDRLVERGMVVVASIGNSGANGVFSASAPGLGEKVIGVASFDNRHVDARTLTVDPSGAQAPYLPLPTTPDPPAEGTTPEVVYLGRGCTSLGDTHLADPDGKVALLIRGDCTFQEKYQGAADAGAVAVVIHNNVTGLFAGGGVTSRGIPGIGISQADGLHIRELLDAGETVTFTWTDQRLDAPNPTGGLISSFSSYGLAPDLALKPDIGAPGGLIRSTYPLALGGYATVSGTSMSAPHVAGAVALLLEAKPRTKATAVREILQNTADPAPWWGNPGLGFLDNVHRQGAGMLDIPGALRATTSVTPAKLALGESEPGPARRTVTIRNTSQSTVTYTLSHDPALSTGGSTFSPSFFTGFADVAFSRSTVTVRPGRTARVSVTITANPDLADRSQYGGYLVATGDNGEVVRVPYAGFKGDYQSIQALTPTAAGFPWLATQQDESYTNRPDGATFTLAGDDVPYLLLHLDHQVRLLRVSVREIRNGESGRHRAVAIEQEYVARNGAPNAFFAYVWDGTVERGGQRVAVRDGSYVLELKVLKALGDPRNPAHWESWTSPVVTIARTYS